MSYTLYYLPKSRGFAEKIRMFLAETGIKFQEVAMSTDELEKWTVTGKVNFGLLPALEIPGGAIIEQSKWPHIMLTDCAIMEYIAEVADKEGRGQGGNKYCGLPKETAIIRGFNNAVHDFQKEIKTYLGKDGAPQDAPAIVAKWFTLFQAILERNDDNDIQTDEYMYGKNLTFADISCFEAVNAVVNVHGLKVLRPYPKLKEFHDKVAARARIEHHIQTRASGF